MPCDNRMVDTYYHDFVHIFLQYDTKNESQCKMWTVGGNGVGMWAHGLLPMNLSSEGCG